MDMAQIGAMCAIMGGPVARHSAAQIGRYLKSICWKPSWSAASATWTCRGRRTLGWTKNRKAAPTRGSCVAYVADTT
jgi:hypothetical protein